MADPLVTKDDVEARLGRPLTLDEAARFDVVQGDVAAYLRVFAPRIPATAPIPDAVVGVASRMVIQALAAPPGAAPVTQESLGGYSVTYRASADGMSIDADTARVLAPWRRPRIAGVPVDPTTVVVDGAS